MTIDEAIASGYVKFREIPLNKWTYARVVGKREPDEDSNARKYPLIIELGTNPHNVEAIAGTKRTYLRWPDDRVIVIDENEYEAACVIEG